MFEHEGTDSDLLAQECSGHSQTKRSDFELFEEENFQSQQQFG